MSLEILAREQPTGNGAFTFTDCPNCARVKEWHKRKSLKDVGLKRSRKARPNRL